MREGGREGEGERTRLYLLEVMEFERLVNAKFLKTKLHATLKFIVICTKINDKCKLQYTIGDTSIPNSLHGRV